MHRQKRTFGGLIVIGLLALSTSIGIGHAEAATGRHAILKHQAATTPLKRYDGNLKIATAGTVIDGLDIHGRVSVNAPDVVIKNSIIRGPDGGQTDVDHAALLMPRSTGTVIEDVEIVPTVPTKWDTGIQGYEFTMTRTNIHGMQDGVMIYQTGNVTIKDSRIWDERHYLVDAGPPSDPTGPSHDDGIQIEGGSDILVQNTIIAGGYNSGVQFTQNNSKTDNVVFDGDTFSSGNGVPGGCGINIHDNTQRGAFTGLVVKNSRFSNSSRLVGGCAIIAPTASRPTVSDSTWTETGTAISVRQGS